MIKYPLNVTIDTNIFEANKYDFSTDSTMGLLVKNVQNGKIKLVLSNIVISEVEKHICRSVDSVCGKARKLRKEYLDKLSEQYLVDIGMGIYVQIPDKETIHKSAKDVFEKFLEDCNVERLDTCGINLEKILEDYFSVRPPFENSEKKRKEFPDAFIAEEIKKRFGNDETVAIVSQDHGFIKACTNSKNHMFFSSLGELFDTLSKNEKEYTAALEHIKRSYDSIKQTISDMIDDSCVEVHGLSYDRDGVADGYDYDETYLEHCNLLDMNLHTIDDIDGNEITASLWIHGNMSVDCYFDDFDNAPWDSEEKEYVFVEQKHIFEKHDVRFPCRVELNSKTGEIRVLPFTIVLGGDSRESRVEIDDEQENLYREFEDADREELGFVPLSKYADVLAEDLNESSIAQEILKVFEQYNGISSDYEDLLLRYDEFDTQIENEMKEDDAKAFINAFSSVTSSSMDLSCTNTDENLKNVRYWILCKEESISQRTERKLPDSIKYGENIKIFGTDDKVYTLFFDELRGTPEAGSEERINIFLLEDKEMLARGYVNLIVGYLNFDEDGGASDGVEDSIEYEADDVVNALKRLVVELKEEFNKEQKIVNDLDARLKRKADN